MSARQTVLFICTGNSARSQMAEGLVRHFLGDRWEAFSAGTRPAKYVHPLAVQVMAELGIDIAGQRPKPIGEFRHASPDVVITVCDSAAEDCPLWLGSGRRVHMGYPDPAQASGGLDERLAAFRAVRDVIRAEVLAHLAGGAQK